MPFNVTGIYNLSKPTSFASKQVKVFNNVSNKQQMIAAIMQPSTTTISFGNYLSTSNSEAAKEIKPDTVKLCGSESRLTRSDCRKSLGVVKLTQQQQR